MAFDRKEYQHQHYLRNKEKVSARGKLRRKEKRAEINDYMRRYRLEKPEVGRRGWRKYQKNNKEKIRLFRQRSYYKNLEENRKKNRESKRLEYARNAEKIKARNNLWASKNTPIIRLASSKRRALKRAAAVNLHKMREWCESVLNKSKVVCYYCSQPTSTANIHFDHIIPLIKGGLHSVDNLCVSCATCNLKKGSKLINSWDRIGQQVLPV